MRFRYFVNYFLWMSSWIILGIIVFFVAIIFFLKKLGKDGDKEEDRLIKMDEYHNIFPLLEKIDEYFELKDEIFLKGDFILLKDILSVIKTIANKTIPIIFDENLIFYLHEIIDRINFLKDYLYDRKFAEEELKELEKTFENLRNWYREESDEEQTF